MVLSRAALPRDVEVVVEGGRPVARSVRVVGAFLGRLAGVLGGWPAGRDGILLTPCRAIHTFFLREPLDVAFLALDGTVLRLAEAMPPWRVAGCPGAWATLELPSSSLRRAGVRPGDRLLFRRCGG